jgi:hypothetical protein
MSFGLYPIMMHLLVGRCLAKEAKERPKGKPVILGSTCRKTDVRRRAGHARDRIISKASPAEGTD